MKRAILLSFVLLAAFGLSGCSYNDLTAKYQKVNANWSKVESAMQRRADLIPNLVEAAKMAGIQEQEVFGQIADARSRLLEASKPGAAAEKTAEEKQAVIEANSTFGGTIGRLLSLQESYPVLRSNESFLKLQDELSSTENRIKVARDDYSDAVNDYNTTRNAFPAVITASLFGFKEQPYFKADDTTVPKVGDANSLRRTQPAAPAAPAPPANK